MARVKQAAPVRREPSSEYVSKNDRAAAIAAKRQEANGHTPQSKMSNGSATGKPSAKSAAGHKTAGFQQAAIAVGGIYGSFLTWGYLQEKLTTTAYPAPANDGTTEVFHFPVFLNTVQSAMAAGTGLLYLWATTPAGRAVPPIMPTARLLWPLLLVALTSSLASPFGYASLAHIDYITYILAKSCKLLPVMFLHVTLFRRRYPLYKYLVVIAVTAGVAVFTLHTGSASKRRGSRATASASGHTAWGLMLLGINLLFDGLTNSTQDYIFEAFRPFSGPQMMCANSLMQTAVTGAYLLVVSPFLVRSGLGTWLGTVDDAAVAAAAEAASVGGGGLLGLIGSGELAEALTFLQRHPAVWQDVLGFAACGAVGQIFIFYALSTFSSVFLVTVTVTRKMCTMILSVVAFGHRLSHMQWLGVALVFGGIGVEAKIARAEKLKKQADKAAKTQ